MKHPQYEELLFSDKKLTHEQEATLSHHLETCRPCREFASAWNGLEISFLQSGDIAPVPGFTARWEQTREVYDNRLRSWTGWLLMSLGAVLVAVMLLSPIVASLAMPIGLISAITAGFTGMVKFVSAIWSLLQSIGRLLPPIPLAVWVSVLNFSIVMLVTIWLMAIKQFPIKQGV